MKTDFYRHFTVIIGGIDAPECCRTLRTEERYLPAILTELGVYTQEPAGFDNERIRIGRKVVDVWVNRK